MIGRHPHKFAIAAWFDGEGADSVGAHVLRCHSCRRHAEELARVRSWLRAQPFVAMSDDAEEPRVPRHRWRPVMVVAVLLLAYLTAPIGDDRGDRSPGGSLSTLSNHAEDPASPPLPSGSVGPAVPEPGELAIPTEPGAFAPPSPTNGAGSPLGSDGGVARRQGGSSPLKLGLIVPTSGPLAREGVEVREVVQRRVQAANSSGGVAGVPIDLVVVPAEDTAAIEAMAARVTAIVGGFGGAHVTTDTPWIFPADPAVGGTNVVPVEASPRAAGAQLAADLRSDGPFGLVGVVVGSGPEAGLAAGLASKARVTTVTAKKNTSCLSELAALRRSGAMTLAVAGDSDLVASCIRAASRVAWSPRLGPLVAPSAAYAGVASLPEATGTRTVLALPWPTSSAAGAARFRATSTSQSYRALVSYAATELAIEVARQTGGVSLAAMAGRTWTSDLLDLDGLANKPGSVTSALFGAWIPVP